ncbi:MAG TPA: ABC transporter permease [Candidatus Angelobacter sp.]|jgi:predicted permease
MNDLWTNIQYTFRVAKKNPFVSFVVILAMAIGIGANTAIFGLANAVFFRPLPYPDSDRLAFLWETNEHTGEIESRVSYPNYADWRAQNSNFSDMGFFIPTKTVLSGSGEPTRLTSALISTNLFSVLGVHPDLGRDFTAEDQMPGHENVVILSDRLWRDRFAGDKKVIGKMVQFGDTRKEVVGVMPAAFGFPEGTQLWMPRVINEFLQTKTRQYHSLAVIGRLKSAVDWDRAGGELNMIADRLALAYPGSNGSVRVRIVPMRQQLSQTVRQGIIILWTAIGAIFLIACLNVASLIVARASARHREIAIRVSLGSSRARILGQFFTESAVHAFVGAILGFGLAWIALRVMSGLNPEIRNLGASLLDIRVFLYATSITLFTAVICGLLPSFSATKVEVYQQLRNLTLGARSSKALTVRNALVCVQISLAFALLVGSALLVKSLSRVLSQDPGFDARHVLTLHVYWPNAAADSVEVKLRNTQLVQVMNKVRNLPGVTSVASVSRVLFPEEMYKVPALLEAQSAQTSEDKLLLTSLEATPDYFRSMGISLLAGRSFNDTDVLNSSAPVAMVNEDMAKHFGGAQSAIGKRFRLGDANYQQQWLTIIGVVRNIREDGLEKSPGLLAYFPSSGYWGDDVPIRTSVLPLSLLSSIRQQIHGVNGNLAIDNVHVAGELLDSHELQRSFNASLLGTLAAVALVLAIIGIYATISYWVRQRTQEIGIRMALGAERAGIILLILKQGLRLVGTGLPLGIIGALAAGRLMQSALYGVSPYDVPVLAGSTALILLTSIVACYVPAIRAARTNPLEALRTD